MEAKLFFIACALAIGGFVAWRRGMKMHRLMHGTPTSKIATAAKGFVEITGRARPFLPTPLRDPITDEECLWFYVCTEQRKRWGKRKTWEKIKEAQSSRAFVLEDDTARCMIEPKGAEIEKKRPDTVIYEHSDLRHLVWRIRVGNALYALGHLERLSTSIALPSSRPAETVLVTTTNGDPEQQALSLLRSWKQNQAVLIERFDADGDGRIDPEEWESARQAARAQVRGKATAATPSAPRETTSSATAVNAQITHALKVPQGGDRRLFVSLQSAATLESGALWQKRLGLIAFVLGALYLIVTIGMKIDR